MYPHIETSSKGVLELVHSDIFGPMSMMLIIGFFHFAIFIYDYSKKIGSTS